MSRLIASPRVRWTVLALAALGTGLAVQWSSTLGAPEGEVVAPARTGRAAAGAMSAAPAVNGADDASRTPARRATASTNPMADTAALLPLRPRTTRDPAADPFALQPTTAAITAAAAAAPVAAPASPPTAPPLPFTYLGRWTENGRTAVFLQHHGSNLTVTGPGPLTADYEVRRIDDQAMELVYRPLQQVQRLALTRSAADDAGVPTVSAATAAAGSPPPEEGN